MVARAFVSVFFLGGQSAGFADLPLTVVVCVFGLSCFTPSLPLVVVVASRFFFLVGFLALRPFSPFFSSFLLSFLCHAQRQGEWSPVSARAHLSLPFLSLSRTL